MFHQAARRFRIFAKKVIFKCLRHVCKTPLLRVYFLLAERDFFVCDTKRFLQLRSHSFFACFIAEEVRPFVRTVEACIKEEFREIAKGVMHSALRTKQMQQQENVSILNSLLASSVALLFFKVTFQDRVVQVRLRVLPRAIQVVACYRPRAHPT